MRSLLTVLLLCASGLAPAQDFGLRNAHVNCSRDRMELMFELSAALESGDVNRIAALYDWNGMDTPASRRVMDRLEALAARPLLDVSPVYPPDPAGTDLPPWPVTLAEQAPVALRVLQADTGGVDAVSTTFALHRRMGCWWVAF